MNKSVASLLSACALLGASATPALADCVSDMKTLEPKVSELSNAAKKEKAQRAITLALEQDEKGDQKGCQKHLGEAYRVAGIRK